MFRIHLNAIENESVVNNPSDVNSNVIQMLKEVAETLIQNGTDPTTCKVENLLKISLVDTFQQTHFYQNAGI